MSRSPQSPDLAVVMPIYNEAANIGSVLDEWFLALDKVSVNFLFFAINDGSTDDTTKILSSLTHELGPRLWVVNKKNSGHGRSCRFGYEQALAEGAPWILQIDSVDQINAGLCAFVGKLQVSIGVPLWHLFPTITVQQAPTIK